METPAISPVRNGKVLSVSRSYPPGSLLDCVWSQTEDKALLRPSPEAVLLSIHLAGILENGDAVQAKLLFSEISTGCDKGKTPLQAQTLCNSMYILKVVLVSIYTVGQIFVLRDSKEEKAPLSGESAFLFSEMADRDR